MTDLSDNERKVLKVLVNQIDWKNQEVDYKDLKKPLEIANEAHLFEDKKCDCGVFCKYANMHRAQLVRQTIGSLRDKGMRVFSAVLKRSIEGNKAIAKKRGYGVPANEEMVKYAIDRLKQKERGTRQTRQMAESLLQDIKKKGSSTVLKREKQRMTNAIKVKE